MVDFVRLKMYNYINNAKGEIELKKILALVLCLVMAVTVFTSCDKTMTMDEILKDTNIVVGSISGKGTKLDIHAYEILYLMNMDYTADAAFDSVKQVKTLQLKAIENGIELDEDAIAEVDKQIDGYIEQFGSEEALVEQLSQLGVTYEQFYEITKMSQQASMFQSKMGELGLFEEVNDQEAKAYFNGTFLKAKHILISTMNTETNEPLSEEEQAKKKAEADRISDAIKGGDDFENYAELSEDPGSETAPDGYVFAKVSELPDDSEEKQYLAYSGLAMVEEFEKGTVALAIDGVSEPVKSQYGYHIIKRLALTDADYTNNADMVKSLMNNQKFIKTVKEWEDSYKVKKNEKILASIDIEAFRATLPQPEAEPEAQPEAEPTPEPEATKPEE